MAGVLVIRGGGLGDFVVTVPAMRALAAAGRHVRLMARPDYAALIAHEPWVEAVLDVRGRAASTLWGGEPGAEARDFVAGCHAAVSFVPDGYGRLRAGLRACGVREVIDASDLPPPGMYAAEHFARRVSPLGSGDSAVIPRIALRPGVVPRGRGCAVLHPGSGSPRKNVRMEAWAEAVGHWMSLGWRSWRVVEGEADAESVAAMRQAWPWGEPEVVRPAGVAELAAALSGADWYCGNDSGVSHLAAALGVPTLVAFVATDPSIWAPRGDHVRVVADAGGPGAGARLALAGTALH